MQAYIDDYNTTKVTGSVSKDATKPATNADDVVEEKNCVKLVPVKSLQEEKSLDNKKEAKLQSTDRKS